MDGIRQAHNGCARRPPLSPFCDDRRFVHFTFYPQNTRATILLTAELERPIHSLGDVMTKLKIMKHRFDLDCEMGPLIESFVESACGMVLARPH
jgi:hypothetical protein